MKRFDWATLPASALLAAMLGVSSVFCPVTAFSIPVRTPVLVGLCCAGALLWAICLSFRHAWPFVCLLLAGTAALAWHWQAEAIGGLCLTIERISACYALAFGTPQLTLSVPASADAAVFLAFVSLLPSGFTAWTVSKRLSVWPALVVCAVGPILCFNILETVPSAWALLLFSAGVLLLLLTQPIRRQSIRGGSRATLCMALPAALTVLALFLPIALGAVSRPAWADSTGKQLEEAFSTLDFSLLPSAGGQSGSASSLSSRLSTVEPVDLTDVGPNHSGSRKVLSVYSTESGTLYLRGASLGTYTGQAWTPLDSSAYGTQAITSSAPVNFTPLPMAGTAEQEITVHMHTSPDVLYCPYYPAELPDAALPVDDVYYRPAGRSYTVSYAASPAGGTDASYDSFAAAQYLAIPDSIAPTLAALQRSEGLSTVSDVADYVRSCAVYNLDAPRAPDGEDFALWFLQEGQEGYCVHFATAAVLLLREIGVPARYVSGYLVEAEANQWVDVTEQQAHAWAEYYTPGSGWAVLDATPSETGDTDEPATASDVVPDDAVLPDDTPQPDSTAKSGSDDTPSGVPAPAAVQLPRWLLPVAVLAALLLAAVLTQRTVVLLRRRRFRRGEPNQRALALWEHILRLSGQLGTPPPGDAEQMALRARFGPRQLTEAELGILRCTADVLEQQLRHGSVRRRLRCRWVHALF